MKVAIVHDWFVGGGAEQVAYQLHRLFPDAPVYTSYCDDEWRTNFNGRIKTGYLQHWPFSKLRKFIPFLRVWWFSSLKLDDYDLVISSSGAEAKFIKTRAGTKHIAYIHAPTHYYWDRYDDYLKHPGFGAFDWLARLGLKILVGPMRKWDYRAAQRPDQLIANSNFTRRQIKKYYGRDSTVIHPPVEVEKFKLLNKLSTSRRGFVVAGRQTPYKRIDLAVAACTSLGLPLTVIGDGPDNKKLRKMAGPTIKFTGRISTRQMVEYFQQAEAFIFPGQDDFGIVAIEAMAAGTPVIALKGGGALDYINNDSGIFFDKQTVDSLVGSIKEFEKSKFSAEEVSKIATLFSIAKFRERMKLFIQSAAKNP